MPRSLIGRLHFGGADISFRKKFRLFFVVAFVVLLSGVKPALHFFGLELLELNSLFTSSMGGAIFLLDELEISLRRTLDDAGRRQTAEVR